MYEQDAHAAAESFRDLFTRLGPTRPRLRRARRDLTAALARYDRLAIRAEKQAEFWRREGAPETLLDAQAHHYRRCQAIAEAKLAVLDDMTTTH